MDDIILVIVSCLPVRDILKCSSMNFQFYRQCSSQILWKLQLKIDYPKVQIFNDTFPLTYIACDEIKKMMGHYVVPIEKFLERKHFYPAYGVNTSFQLLPAIRHMQNLTEILLRYQPHVKTLPSEIGKLVNLEKIYCENCGITTIPTTLGLLINLKKFSVFNCNLQTIPTEIGNLQNLEELLLINDNLNQLPTELGKLEKLIVLNLHHNSLKTIPSELGSLTKLRCLSIDKNIFIPKEINPNILVY